MFIFSICRHTPIVVTLLFIIFLATSLSSCGSAKLTSKQLSEPYIQSVIQPKRLQNTIGTRIGIFDFQVPDNGLQNLSKDLTTYAQRYLLEAEFMQAGHVAEEYAESFEEGMNIDLAGQYPGNIQEAIYIGEKNNYDLILIGKVEKYIFGGLHFNSKAQLTLKMIHVHSSKTLWFLNGQMLGYYQEPRDCIFFSYDDRKAPSPSILCLKITQEILKSLTQFSAEFEVNGS
jgi:hypothetical protein